VGIPVVYPYPSPIESAKQENTLCLIPAAPDDAEALAAMALDIWHRYYFPNILTLAEIRHLWHRSYRPEALRREIEAGSVFRWIERSPKRIGFLAYRHEPERSRLRLSKLYLLPEHHRQGIGAFALDEIKRTAAQLDVREIMLYVFKKNEQAIRAYRRAGFKIADEEVSDAGEGFFYDDYVMSLTLDQSPNAVPDTDTGR
jgi:ribosomal protein S18 acetylase RimI-like enzyme